MNQSQHQAARSDQLAALAVCADCDSSVTLVENVPGIVHAYVQHDETCPTYQRMQT